jgi:predicted acylesterase/phospholipase RssA
MRKPENYPLRLVSTELTTQNMVVLPRDAHLFYKDQQSAGPSDFVLASSTIPVYFMPFKHVLPRGIDLKATQALWKTELLFDGPVSESVVFADGAILSNLPINLFHSSPGPQLAKIGLMVTMGGERDAPLKIDSLQSYIAALSSTTRLLNDRSYRHDNPIYDDCIVSIMASDFPQLDFDMSKEQREKLLIRGMEAGRRFLEKWRKSKRCWEIFKEKHAQLEMATACKGSATDVTAAAPAEAAAASG